MGLREALTSAAQVLDRWVATDLIAGGCLAVHVAGGPAFSLAVGTAEPGQPMEVDRRFLITSISKGLTAVQLLSLVDSGHVDLRAPVCSYLPAFVDGGKEQVQVWHLLAHCSGVSQRANVAEGLPTTASPQELQRYAVELPLARTPGVVEYCSPAFWVVAAIIEAVTGCSHAEHLRDLAGPYCQQDLGYAPDPAPPQGYVPARADRNAHLAEQVRRLAYPAGGIVSSADALAAFGAALAGGLQDGKGPLSPAMLRTLSTVWSEGRWPDGRPAVWGLGWELSPAGDGWPTGTVFHSGASGTGRWVDLRSGVCAVLLTADWYLERRRLAEVANAITAGLSRYQSSVSSARSDTLWPTDDDRGHAGLGTDERSTP